MIVFDTKQKASPQMGTANTYFIIPLGLKLSLNWWRYHRFKAPLHHILLRMGLSIWPPH